jgi:hypothetical protein
MKNISVLFPRINSIKLIFQNLNNIKILIPALRFIFSKASVMLQSNLLEALISYEENKVL